MAMARWGCRAVGRMAYDHTANTAAAREAGCVQLVAAAMWGHPEGAYGLQVAGRAALRILEPGHALLPPPSLMERFTHD